MIMDNGSRAEKKYRDYAVHEESKLIDSDTETTKTE